MVGCIPLYFWLLNVWRKHPRTDRVKRRQIEEAQKRVDEERNRKAEIEADKLALDKRQIEDSLPPIPSPPQFRANLLKVYHSECKPPLVDSYLEQIVSVFVELYKPITKTQAHLYAQACSIALTNFTRTIPPEFIQASVPSSLFNVQLSMHDQVIEVIGEQWSFRQGYSKAYEVLCAPFKGKQTILGFMDWKNTAPGEHLRAPGPDADEAADKAYWKAFDAALKQESETFPFRFVFMETPFYRKAFELLPNGIFTRPFDIPPEARTRHQWIVGAPGSGKTTFISAMIADDLKQVARNEASIFVMDSQNELIPDIAGLEMFAPGRPLHNKLIYIEPDPDYPLALNIFDTNLSRSRNLSSKERAMIESGAIWMVEFFLSSLVKSDASPHQDTFLNYVIPALMAIPDATIFTFKDLLEGARAKNGPTGYDRYKQHFGGLRQDTQDWLRDRMHSPELATTRNAIRTRLDGFTARGFFHDMFIHPRNKLDLFEEMQTGKVILVNTMKGLLKNGTEPFGRYFIARLLQAAEERMFVSRGARLPVYVYLDEASDYIAEEENIEELINKARKQNIALIIANQMESQITSPVVRDALSRVAIQCRGEPGDVGEPPKWDIAIGNREPVQILVPNVNFADMPKMSTIHYELMLADMRRRFSSPAGTSHQGNGHAEPPPHQDQSHHRKDPPETESPTGPPKDDDYDERYDSFEILPLNPVKARNGTILTIKCPNNHEHLQSIPPGTHNGYRFCIRGVSKARRPDNRNGNFLVELAIADMGGAKPEADETDAKPW
jgi:hypothetical protein